MVALLFGVRRTVSLRAKFTPDWVLLPGRIGASALVDLYRRAWVLASASVHEGWGMTVTEAAACGTPAVATRIAGHSDAIVDGSTGLLVEDAAGLAYALDRVLGDDTLRARLARLGPRTSCFTS